MITVTASQASPELVLGRRAVAQWERWTATFGLFPRSHNNMKSKLVVVLWVLAMLVSGCATLHTAPEYKVLEGYSPSAIEKELNELGSQGWVVVSSTSPAPFRDNTAMIVIILKRDRK